MSQNPEFRFKSTPSEHPVMSDEERDIINIERLKTEVVKLKKAVEIGKRCKKEITAEKASQIVPYLYCVSDLLVGQILREEPHLDRNMEILLTLIRSRQENKITGNEMDQTYGLAMAEYYFPEEVLKDLEASEKARRLLETELRKQ